MSLDATIAAWLNPVSPAPLWDGLALLCSTLGLLTLPSLALAWWRGPRHPTSMALLLSQAAGLAGALILQQLVARPRPEVLRIVLAQPSSPSFPSGHATLVFAGAGVLLMSRVAPRWKLGALLLAGAVATSRVALGHHWPTDVLAGAVLGLGLGLASHGLVASGSLGFRRWRWLLWPQLSLVVVITAAAWLDLLGGLRVPLSDKQLHFSLFGLVCFWLSLWWEDPARQGGPRRVLRWIPLAFMLPFSLAMAEEIAQHWSPHRTADPVDLACDLAGMICGFLLARLWIARRPQLPWGAAGRPQP